MGTGKAKQRPHGLRDRQGFKGVRAVFWLALTALCSGAIGVGLFVSHSAYTHGPNYLIVLPLAVNVFWAWLAWRVWTLLGPKGMGARLRAAVRKRRAFLWVVPALACASWPMYLFAEMVLVGGHVVTAGKVLSAVLLTAASIIFLLKAVHEELKQMLGGKIPASIAGR